jgi:hypothetical protein
MFSVAPGPGAGQVGMLPDDECRCVDPDGNEIEDCRCFRTLDRGQLAWTFSNSRPRIGITLSTSDDENAAQGATIREVMEDGPADRAGLREGDVITHVNGRSLFDPLRDEDAEADLDPDGSLPAQRLLQMSRELEPGEEVELRYLRNGEPATTTVTAEDLEGWGGNYLFFGENLGGRWDPEAFEGQWKEAIEQFESQWDPEKFHKQWEETMNQFHDQWDSEEFEEQWKEMAEQFENQNWRRWQFQAPEGEGNVVFWRGEDEPGAVFNVYRDTEPFNLYFGTVGGVHLEALNPNLGEYFGTDSGVLVTEVEEDSTLGLLSGDVILQVADREVTDPVKLRRILRSYEPDEEITFHIMRQKSEMTVSGTLGR